MCTLSPRFAATTLDRCTAACRRPPVRHANRTHSPHFGWPIANRSSERRLVQRHARPHPASGANKLRADRLSAVSFATADARCVCVSVCSVRSVFGCANGTQCGDVVDYVNSASSCACAVACALAPREEGSYYRAYS